MKVFKDKVVLVTGDTGFKGSWLAIWLNSLGAKVAGLSDQIPAGESNYSASRVQDFIDDYRIDIRNLEEVKAAIQDIKPDFIFHLAAQALVRFSYQNPVETITTNAVGTVNLLEATRLLNKKVAVVMITSDKAYDNVEWVWGYRETDRLGGKDPYSASKGMAELAIRSYVESFFGHDNANIRLGIARAGNVIGGGDWAVDRIVPDCMKAWSSGEVVGIRKPNATRPWQHVLEPLSGYLFLAEQLYKNDKFHGNAYNFGPSDNQNYSVKELIGEMSKYWDQIKWNDTSNSSDELYEAGLLKRNCDKALFDLGWLSTLRFDETVKMTVEWYKHYYKNRGGGSMYEFTVSQIEQYIDLARLRNISWYSDND